MEKEENTKFEDVHTFLLCYRWRPQMTQNGRRMQQTRTSTTCSNCWLLATAAWEKHLFSSDTQMIRSRQHSSVPWASTSKWKQYSDRTSGWNYRYGYVSTALSWLFFYNYRYGYVFTALSWLSFYNYRYGYVFTVLSLALSLQLQIWILIHSIVLALSLQLQTWISIHSIDSSFTITDMDTYSQHCLGAFSAASCLPVTVNTTWNVITFLPACNLCLFSQREN